jgi:hypothetical protein
MISTGSWAQYVSDVKDCLADQPHKRKEFDQLLREQKHSYVCDASAVSFTRIY